MDQDLFKKYTKTLIQRKSQLDDIIIFIKQETGVELLPEEISIKKNKLSFQTSSVKKILLRNKNIEDFLYKKGYILTL